MGALRRMTPKLKPRGLMGRQPLAAILVAASLAFFETLPLAVGQDPSDAWTPPRTRDNQPDLQGVWVANSATPLERPSALADRGELTDAEVATLQDRANRIFANGRSAFAAGDSAFHAALENVDTFEAQSTSSSIGMIDRVFYNRTSLVVDPPDGRVPAMTPEARQRQAVVADGWRYKTGPEDFSSNHRCITTGVPRLGGNFGAGPYSYYQIVQSADHVAFIMEAFHDVRLIPLDERRHLPESIQQWNGDSRGRWTGESLVIETSNFALGSYFMGSSRALGLVEWFTRTAEDKLTHRMRFTNPDTWETPWTAETLLSRANQPIYEYACHEGNRSLVGMLTAARLAEADRAVR